LVFSQVVRAGDLAKMCGLYDHEPGPCLDDPTHKQKAIYSLTEKGIALLPILAQIGIWGRRYVAASNKADRDLKAFNRQLEQGGPALWRRLMATLRATHLGGKATRTTR
jgi:hypothetical protein